MAQILLSFAAGSAAALVFVALYAAIESGGHPLFLAVALPAIGASLFVIIVAGREVRAIMRARLRHPARGRR